MVVAVDMTRSVTVTRALQYDDYSYICTDYHLTIIICEYPGEGVTDPNKFLIPNFN